MWVLLFFLLIKFLIVFEKLETVLIPRLFKFSSKMFVDEFELDVCTYGWIAG